MEFSDFQCPYCSRLVPELDQVVQKYGNQVRLVFRQFPLTMHPFAKKAAEAALCANEQGKFWEMHDAMFHDQQGLAVDALKAKAAAIGLNTEHFNYCLDAGKYASGVNTDIEAGEAAGGTEDRRGARRGRPRALRDYLPQKTWVPICTHLLPLGPTCWLPMML